MKTRLLVFILSIALAFSGYAFAQTQPLTRADCTKAGMSWDANGNVCGAGTGAMPAKEEGKQKESKAEKSGGEQMGKKAGKAVGEKKGKKAAKGGKSTKKVVKKTKGNKVVKKVTTSEGTKKSTAKKGANKKEQRKFFRWLKRQDNKS